MKEQGYANHRKFYAPHHFIFLPLVTAMMVFGIVRYVQDAEPVNPWLLFAISSAAILYLALMLRQHYALGNQDRIIRLEFRLRYFELFGRPSKEVEGRLSFGQIAALRFAGDEEFSVLLEKALGGLGSNEIKKQVKNWQADHMRV